MSKPLRPFKPNYDSKWKNPKRVYISTKIMRRVKERFGGLCGYCGCRPKNIQVDHIIPLMSSQGTNEEDNLMPCCRECNSFKSALTLEEFRRELSLQLERANKYSVNFRMARKFFQIIENPSPIIFYFERGRNGR